MCKNTILAGSLAQTTCIQLRHKIKCLCDSIKQVVSSQVFNILYFSTSCIYKCFVQQETLSPTLKPSLMRWGMTKHIGGRTYLQTWDILVVQIILVKNSNCFKFHDLILNLKVAVSHWKQEKSEVQLLKMAFKSL